MEPQRLLLKTQATFMAALFTVLTVFGAGKALDQVVQHGERESLVASAARQEQFWTEVAGPTARQSVGARFARDIRELRGSQVDTFRGNSNTYGGVVDEIGFDPFDRTGLNCDECGPLSGDTRTRLASVQGGGLSSVLTDIHVDPLVGYEFTPFGWPVLSVLTLTWVLGGPPTLAVAHLKLRTTRPSAYVRNFGDIQWERLRPEGVCLVFLNPVVLSAFMLNRRLARARFRDRVREAFPEHMAVLDEVNERLHHLDLSPGLQGELEAERDAVLAELESHTRAGLTREDPLVDHYLLSSLKGVRENLELRAEAKQELEHR